MTTLREAAQMALDALEYPGPSWPDARQQAAEALRAALAAPPEELDLPKVQLWEFLKLIEGKEDFRGIPLMRTEWPTQGEALAQPEQEPVWGDSQVTKPEVIAAQKAMNEGLRNMVEPEPVAWMDAHDSTNLYYRKPPQGDVIPLYFAPPEEIK